MDVAGWAGAFQGRRHDAADSVLEMPLKPSTAGGSGTFLGRADDGHRYWIKPLNNRQGPMVPVTEQIVARVGELIGAPVCEPAIIELPAALAGWEFRPGNTLEPGLAHGCRHVPNCIERRKLIKRADDDNRARHAVIFALFDWCWGGDPQWLFAVQEDHRVYSHDHGWYLPPAGPSFAEQEMLGVADDHRPLTQDSNGLDLAELSAVRDRLRGLSQETIASALSHVPQSWPVTDDALEATGAFLLHRAGQVADRIDTQLGRST